MWFVSFICQNSIRHNLSLHDMFVRETSPDGKISYWTIRPEANRCLTLDQVYKVCITYCATVFRFDFMLQMWSSLISWLIPQPLVDPVTPTCPQIPQAGFNQVRPLFLLIHPLRADRQGVRQGPASPLLQESLILFQGQSDRRKHFQIKIIVFFVHLISRESSKRQTVLRLQLDWMTHFVWK